MSAKPCQRRTGGRRLPAVIGVLYGSRAHLPSERREYDSQSAGPEGRSGAGRAGLTPLDSLPEQSDPTSAPHGTT